MIASVTRALKAGERANGLVVRGAPQGMGGVVGIIERSRHGRQPNWRLQLTGAATNVPFVRQGAVDEAIDEPVRQAPSRPQLKRVALGST
jgi:hypothetical protein